MIAPHAVEELVVVAALGNRMGRELPARLIGFVFLSTLGRNLRGEGDSTPEGQIADGSLGMNEGALGEAAAQRWNPRYATLQPTAPAQPAVGSVERLIQCTGCAEIRSHLQ